LSNAYNQIVPDETDDYNTVTMATGVVDKGYFIKEIVIKLRIHTGYHIYAFVADSDPYIVTDMMIDLPKGYKKTGELKKPSFNYYNKGGTTIYTDEVMFIQAISGSGAGVATCTISYQCCDPHICFPPVFNKVLSITLN